MKPFKSGAIIAAWLLRIMLVWFIYRNYFQTLAGFDLRSFSFYIGAAYLLFGLLLLAGGFLQKPALTVISGLAIFVLPIVQLIKVFPEDLSDVLLLYLIPLSVGFCFFTSGNNQ
jgi:uncharacterized membrane protein YkgB